MFQKALAALAAFYILSAVAWTMPKHFPFKEGLNDIVRSPFLFLGLWQGWEMFTPDPTFDDLYVTVAIEYRDGTKREFNVSRMGTMPYFVRYAKERWRKWGNEYLRLDSNKAMWEPAARYFAKRLPASEGNPIARVELVRHWRTSVPGPISLSEAWEKPWNHFKFFTLEVTPLSKGT